MSGVAAGLRGEDRGYFFVVGQARSGTNWTCRLLNLHPAVRGHGEFHFERLRSGVTEFTRNPNALGAHEPLASKSTRWFEEFVRSTLDDLRHEAPEARWVGDRTPRPLEPLIPDARHFLVIRDGRDVVVSRAHHQMRMGGPWKEPFRTTMQEHAEAFRADPDYFRRHPDRLFADSEWLGVLAAAWSNRMRSDEEGRARFASGEWSGACQVVRYEDIHANTERERNRMYEFLSLDSSRAAALSPESQTSAGFDREQPHSLSRRGESGGWKDHADDRFRETFKRHAGEALIEFGYEQDLNW
ncbi:MAG: sulfotransferase family protein [Phycisphaerales bacterium]